MKNSTVLFLIITLFPLLGFCNFTEFKTLEDGTEFFIDHKTINRVENNVFFYQLINYGDTQNRFLSSKVHIQVDCIKPRFRYLSEKHYKESYGRGDPLEETDKVSPWFIDISNTIQSQINLENCKY